jgi:hypothetical protein
VFVHVYLLRIIFFVLPKRVIFSLLTALSLTTTRRAVKVKITGLKLAPTAVSISAHPAAKMSAPMVEIPQ